MEKNNIYVPENIDREINLKEVEFYKNKFKGKVFSIFIEDNITVHHLNDFIDSLSSLISNGLKFQIFTYPVNKKNGEDFLTPDALSYYTYKFGTEINLLLESKGIKSVLIPGVNIDSDYMKLDLKVDNELIENLLEDKITPIMLPFGFENGKILQNLDYLDFVREVSSKLDTDKIITILSDGEYEIKKYAKISSNELQELIKKDFIAEKVKKYLSKLENFLHKDNDKRLHLLTLGKNSLYLELMTSDGSGVVVRNKNDLLEEQKGYKNGTIIRNK